MKSISRMVGRSALPQAIDIIRSIEIDFADQGIYLPLEKLSSNTGFGMSKEHNKEADIRNQDKRG